MLDRILNDPNLAGLLRGTCSENGVGVSFGQGMLLPDGGLDDDQGLIIKVDAFYSTPHMHNPPPSIDCLVVIRCGDGTFDFYLIELRETTQQARVRHRDIVRKFKTVLDDFISTRFSHVFCTEDVRVGKVRAYLVTDPFQLRDLGLSNEEYRRQIKGTVLDAYANVPPLVFNNLIVPIEPVLPDPAIQPC